MAENNDILKKIKGLFIVDEANQTAPTQQQQSTKSETPMPTVVSDANHADLSGSHNEKVFDSLTQALESNNLQGFDYLEFRTSLLSLSKMPMDEATRYQSAYAMAQTMGVDSNKLTDTAAHYLNVLKNESLKFQQAIDNQQKSGLGSKEQEITGLQNAIAQKTELLKQISTEIEQHTQKIEEIKKQITESGNKIAQAQVDFQTTYNAMVEQINADIEKIKNYIK
ncbi:MAG: hypothetical protein ACOYOA_03615 [Saprospiraceae bacterium]